DGARADTVGLPAVGVEPGAAGARAERVERRLREVSRLQGRGRLRPGDRNEHTADIGLWTADAAAQRPEPHQADRQLHATGGTRLDGQAVSGTDGVHEGEHRQGSLEWRLEPSATGPTGDR